MPPSRAQNATKDDNRLEAKLGKIARSVPHGPGWIKIGIKMVSENDRPGKTLDKVAKEKARTSE